MGRRSVIAKTVRGRHQKVTGSLIATEDSLERAADLSYRRIGLDRVHYARHDILT